MAISNIIYKLQRMFVENLLHSIDTMILLFIRNCLGGPFFGRLLETETLI